MAPQDDLTAERAAQFLKQHFTELLRDDGEPWVGDVELIQDLIKTARQEAMREARDYALACVAERNKQAFELTKTVLNDPRAVWLGCKASEAERIAEWIDRLASEGG